MQKSLLKKIIVYISSFWGGRYAGKMIGFLDFCREAICTNDKVFAGQIHNRMDISNIIPKQRGVHNEQGIPLTDKIKVRIIYPSGDSWNNIHTLYKEFEKDERFQTYVLVKRIDSLIRIMNAVGCNYVTYDNYELSEDRPDILIANLYSTYEKEIIFPGCHQFVNKIYGIIPNAVMNEENNDIHWQYVNRAFSFLNPDLYLADPLVYNALKGYIDEEKLVKIGGCQFDEIYNEIGKKHPIPSLWEKLEGKRVFLWATDHGINESYPKNGFTVDLYLSDMLLYFEKHEELGLIFRPHPQFIREMLLSGHFWSYDDIQKLREYIDSTPNVVWDDTHDFCRAYDTCSALIVDANCSITCSFLTTGKPICRLMRYDLVEWLISPELEDCYYYARNFEECVAFIDRIVEGVDTKKEARARGLEKAVLHFDGKNGERIKRIILEDYYRVNVCR